MSTLVIVEHNNKVMSPSTRHVLTAALQLNQDVILMVMGYQCQAVAEDASRLAGVSAVWVVDNAVFEHPTAESMADVIVSQAKSCSAIVAPASTFGKNCLPRVAAKLDVTQVSDVTNILSEDVFEHPIYAGNAIEKVKVLDSVKVLTLRSTAFDAVNSEQSPCPIQQVDVEIQSNPTQFVRHELTQSKRPDLDSAKIIVSGGRGLQKAEAFKLIEELADVLGAAVGASRAIVDAGFVPNEYQVGQTGRIVAPSLYIAIGISGAVQHLAGMKDSKVIVAINKDEEAPIFQIANYGLVGDLFEIVPQFITLLKGQ